jgi:hypothetical protein
MCTSVPNPDPYVFGLPDPVAVSQRYGSEDPDPYQNVTDPQHCFRGNVLPAIFFCLGDPDLDFRSGGHSGGN